MLYREIREEIVATGRQMLSEGLVTLTAGNLSVRIPDEELLAITPSGRPYDTMRPEDIPIVSLEGRVMDGEFAPSSELPMHMAIMRARPDVGAVVHTHAPHALAFAVARRSLPLISLEGLSSHALSVLVAEYAVPGTDAVGRSVLDALAQQPGSLAVMLANHGFVSIGETLAEAYTVAANIETEARIYLMARSLGTPVAITADQYEAIRRNYGSKKK